MNYECEICNKQFINKYTLKTHIEKSKKCLEKRDSGISPTFKCHCGYVTMREYDFNSHTESCKQIKNGYESFLEKVKKEYEKRLQEQKEYYENLINEYKNDYKKEIETLKNKLDDANNTIAQIALQPKTTHNHLDNSVNNTLIVNTLNLNDTKTISSVLDNYLTKDVLKGGQERLAVMVEQHLLRSADGEPIYRCTDVSRQTFEFVNENGDIEADHKATKLLKSLNESDMYKKASVTAKKIWEKDDGKVDFDAQNVFMTPVLEVLNIENDSTKFRSKLATITAKKVRLKQSGSRKRNKDE